MAEALVDRDGLDALIRSFADEGRLVLGPKAEGGVIRLAPIRGVVDLPEGVDDGQEAGRYRLRRRDDRALFGYVVGPDSPKRHFHPPQVPLWRVREVDGEPAATCFCTSLGTGPAATDGFDPALTELPGDGEPRHLVRTGSPAGGALLSRIPHRPATAEELGAAEAVREVARAAIRRRLAADGLPGRLRAHLEDPAIFDIAGRCLACGNCTMVCSTCFCTRVEHEGDLVSVGFAARRVWDSCFTREFSELHGHPLRGSIAARYRRWFLHKLSTWVEQFGTLGCVGCGRCIAWCPVGIDITEEAARILEGEEGS